MSLFDNIKARAGIGNAKVDTRIHQVKVQQGGVVTGEVMVTGGSVEQEINAISLSVETTVLVEQDDRKYSQNQQIQRIKVSDAFTIGAKEKKILPFSFTLSYETPMSIGRNEVWIATLVDVSFALDPKDKDHLEVNGTELAEKVLAAIQQLGFTLKTAANLKSRQTKTGLVQEFEFHPGPDFKRHFTELEVIFSSDVSGTTIFIEMDHKAKGLGGLLAQALEMDESRLSMHWEQRNKSSVSEIAQELRDVLLQNIR